MSLLYSDDYSLVTGFDPIANTESKDAYSLDIFMDNGFIYYTRSYKRLIMIISNVFPIMQMLYKSRLKMNFSKNYLNSFLNFIFNNKKYINRI